MELKIGHFCKHGSPGDQSTRPKSIRDLFVGNYTVRYLKDEYTIIILRIWHDKEAEKDS
jgi:plasmid stabilization system protein ParE